MTRELLCLRVARQRDSVAQRTLPHGEVDKRLRTGEVVWSSTQESKGAKYMGSAADVAERIARDLEQACKRARQIERTQADATHDVGR